MKRNPKIAIFITLTLVVSSLLGIAMIVGAQDQNQPPQAPPASQPEWTANQLDNLVAPIALYPDPLLSQMLVASTYPLEIVEAGQWLDHNKNLSGQALIDAAKQQPWDPSIQTLVAVPDALQKLDEDIQWTTDLGNAFLAQEADVMNAVQRMRLRAEANGRLASTKQQNVITRYDGGQQVVVIEPAYPDVIYVPVYDPFYVWGAPAYGFYPPLYYPSFGFGFGYGCNVGFFFSDWGGWGFWGWGPSWNSHSIFVNNYFFNRYGFRHHWGGGEHDRMTWVHNPVHRLNIPYRDSRVAARFNGYSTGSRDSFRNAAGRNGSNMRFADRPDNRLAAGRNMDQGNRNAPTAAQRYQNSGRERYQSVPQNQIASNRNRMTPQVQRYQNQAQTRPQAQQQYRSNPQRYNEGPRVIPFGSQRQESQARQQNRSDQQVYRAPQAQRYQSAPQQYRSAPQVYRAPQVQQYRSAPQQRFQAAPQFRSAPQMSAPRYSGGGGAGRTSGGGGFSRGNGGGSGRGGGRGR